MYLPHALAAAALALLATTVVSAAESVHRPTGARIHTDVAYKHDADLSEYERARCRLDVYLPAVGKGFPTLVWFHGGGLVAGDKGVARAMALSLARAGVAVVAANYRLSPAAKYPDYLHDAAAAVAWTRAHIAGYGGDPAQTFIGGHSAGGYITLMIGLDERHLGARGIALADIAGLISVSGQTMTHNVVRAERGLGRFSIVADEAAPVYYGRRDTPRILVLYADRDKVARAAEGRYFVEIMRGAGNRRVTGRLIVDRTHETIVGRMANDDDPARQAILDFIRPTAKRPVMIGR